MAPPLMLSLSKVVTSEATTTPWPGKPPPVGCPAGRVLVEVVKPSDLKMPGASALTVRPLPVSSPVTGSVVPAVPEFSVTLPVAGSTLLGVDPVPVLPVIWSTALRRSPTELPGLSESVAGVAGGPALAGVIVYGDVGREGVAEAVKLMTTPLTVIVSPLATAGTKLLNGVVLLIALPPLSTALLPTSDVLVNAAGGVPVTVGLLAPKSAPLRPPLATIEPVGAFGLAVVTGTVGRFAAYWIAVVACAGTKLLLNCKTVGTLPSGLPVFGSTAVPIR